MLPIWLADAGRADAAEKSDAVVLGVGDRRGGGRAGTVERIEGVFTASLAPDGSHQQRLRGRIGLPGRLDGPTRLGAGRSRVGDRHGEAGNALGVDDGHGNVEGGCRPFGS